MTISFAVAAPVLPGAVAPRYSPPDLPAVAKNQLDVLNLEIAQNNLADAARRIDSLLKDSPDGLTEADDTGGVISLQTWIEQLPEPQRAALSREYRVEFEDTDARGVRQLLERGTHQPESGRRAAVARVLAEPAQLLAIARRYPFAPSAIDAILAAARCSAGLGDSTAAADLFRLARARGWKERNEPTSPATQPSGGEYSGPLPFVVPWFANLTSGGSPTSNATAATLQEERLMPVTNRRVVYLSTSRGAMALSEERDAPMWQSSPGDDGPPTNSRPNSRGASFAPALLCDDLGTARIVVVRQMGPTGDYELRAMRASDGRKLWGTDGSTELRGMNIASHPAIAGRFVYVLGVDVGEQEDRLVMLALDVTGGRVLWRSEIGSVARRGSGRFTRSRDPVLDVPDPWQNLSAPAVDADSVYIAPNCGAVIAVDRFDGHLHWIRPYASTGAAEAAVPKPARRPNVRVRELPSTGIPRASVFRWNTTPQRVGDDLLVVAPHDSDRVFALSSRTGKNLWHTDSLASATLFGAAGKLVFLSERSITALDVEKLDAAWTWEGGAVGPATLCTSGAAAQIRVPTAGGLVTLSAADGAAVAPSSNSTVPDLSALAKSDTIRSAMQEAGALDLLTGDPPEPKKRTR
ncbi:hypothetical protein BH09PLA1_BH09PLA1_04230 [soil metagenome]